MQPTLRQRVVRLLAVTVLGAVSLGGAPTTAVAGETSVQAVGEDGFDWTSDGGGPANRYWNPEESAITPRTVGSLSEAYTIKPPQPPRGAPLVVDGTVYQTHDGGVTAYDASDGTQLWNHPTKTTPSDAVFSGDTLYVSTGRLGETSTLYAIGADGARKWTRQTSNVIFDQLVAKADRIVVSGASRGPGAHRVLAYRPGGSIAWSRHGAEIAPRSSMADQNGRIYLRPWSGTSAKEQTVAVSLENGENQWRIDRAVEPRAIQPSTGAAVAMEDLGVVTHRMLSFRTGDATMRWDVPTSWYGSAAEVAVDAERIYLPEGDDDVQALRARDAETGEVEWRASTPEGADMSAPVVAGGLVYMEVNDGGSDARLNAYRADRGNRVWTHRLDDVDDFRSHPVVVEGTLYLPDKVGVTALRPQ